MLAVKAASMKFFRVFSCFSLFKKNFPVTGFTDPLLFSANKLRGIIVID